MKRINTHSSLRSSSKNTQSGRFGSSFKPLSLQQHWPYVRKVAKTGILLWHVSISVVHILILLPPCQEGMPCPPLSTPTIRVLIVLYFIAPPCPLIHTHFRFLFRISFLNELVCCTGPWLTVDRVHTCITTRNWWSSASAREPHSNGSISGGCRIQSREIFGILGFLQITLSGQLPWCQPSPSEGYRLPCGCFWVSGNCWVEKRATDDDQ